MNFLLSGAHFKSEDIKTVAYLILSIATFLFSIYFIVSWLLERKESNIDFLSSDIPENLADSPNLEPAKDSEELANEDSDLYISRPDDPIDKHTLEQDKPIEQVFMNRITQNPLDEQPNEFSSLLEDQSTRRQIAVLDLHNPTTRLQFLKLIYKRNPYLFSCNYGYDKEKKKGQFRYFIELDQLLGQRIKEEKILNASLNDREDYTESNKSKDENRICTLDTTNNMQPKISLPKIVNPAVGNLYGSNPYLKNFNDQKTPFQDFYTITCPKSCSQGLNLQSHANLCAKKKTTDNKSKTSFIR